jgi:DNA polymerase III epsilon subunit family exonuclease
MKKLIPAILCMLVIAVYADVSDLVFVAFDVESTGFGPDQDRIIEIGAAKYRDGKTVESTHWLINPGIPIKNSFVHGITEEDVAGHPGFADTYKAFRAFAGDSILIAHNASFDVRFMAAEIKRNGLEPMPNPTINSLALFRRWYPAAPSHKLGELAAHLDLPVAAEHRAQDDSETLLRILDHGLKSMPNITLAELKTAANGTYHFDGSRQP